MIPEQHVDASLVTGRRVLLVGGEIGSNASRHGVVGVDDLDPEPLQWAVADVASPHEVEVGAAGGIKTHGVMEIEEAAAPFHEGGHGALLLRSHPDEVVLAILVRTL